ncbi:rhamnosyltransferase [Tistrella bauzanensis]|uniref:Rhamnosyltransferase n=1 Tax=Tistrella bauzanensis TaxID=657419 RepID=A0ABQ1IIZ2_9PROT|nr:ferritin-like domain-containing protein [Tistrella bauzanensis]GGB40278.1 rhamnosyltransferase [Tistrella bauzanensis]
MTSARHPDMPAASFAVAACTVLLTAEPRAKAAAARALHSAWQGGGIPAPAPEDAAALPDRPARPDRPELLSPARMPKRGRGGSTASRVRLLHALAHIEFNAIDLAVDMAARFSAVIDPDPVVQRRFADDWLAIADDEARHFGLITDRLADLGAAYGDQPAHDGLWSAAMATAHDMLGRLAVVPMVLEARGLDVTPEMIRRLDAFGDTASADALRVIYADEVGHVAAGLRWLSHAAEAHGLDPRQVFHDRVRTLFPGRVKPPFNAEARARAGMAPEDYEPLADVVDPGGLHP